MPDAKPLVMRGLADVAAQLLHTETDWQQETQYI